MTPLLERITTGDVLVADGAIGTMLFERGLRPGSCPETVNLERPEILEEIAALYLDAGAELLQTNTFGASPLKLACYGLEDQTERIVERAVQAVRAVAKDRAYVCGSCGPCGALLKPYGDTEPDAVAEGFRRQINSMVNAGVDVICVETMVDLREAALAIEAAKDIAPSLPVMATMAFDATPRGFHTIMGVNIEQAAKGLRRAGADVLGSNCGNGSEGMLKVAREFQTHTELPRIIQPNAGLPVQTGDQTTYSETASFMADCATQFLAAGVSIIGGCCGTTPEHIRAIRQAVDGR